MKRYSSATKGNSRRTFLNKRILTALALGGVLLLVLTFAPRVLGTVGSVVLRPVVSVQTWIAESGGALPSYIRDRDALREEERDLRRQLAEHASAQVRADVLAVENGELRNLLAAATEPRIAAAVIGRPSTLPYDVFLVDRGRDDGVQENAPVYAAGDRVIGFVAAAYQHSAVVALVTTPGFESTVYIYGPNIYTTALGMGGGSLRVSVPQGIELAEGNQVILPSLDTGIYGELSVIDSEPSRPEQYGFVSMEEPLTGVHFVSIGRTTLEPVSFEEAKAAVEAARREVLTAPVPSGVLVEVETGTTTATTTDESTP